MPHLGIHLQGDHSDDKSKRIKEHEENIYRDRELASAVHQFYFDGEDWILYALTQDNDD